LFSNCENVRDAGAILEACLFAVEIEPLQWRAIASTAEYADRMARSDPAAEVSATARTGSWRELAVARSLDPARSRAEKRVQRFLDAALDLLDQAFAIGRRAKPADAALIQARAARARGMQPA